jgi:hypothetical protein
MDKLNSKKWKKSSFYEEKKFGWTDSRKQSYKRNFVFKKTKLILKTETAHYLKIGLSNNNNISNEVTYCQEI